MSDEDLVPTLRNVHGRDMDESELFDLIILAQEGDIKARNEIIEGNLGLLLKFATKNYDISQRTTTADMVSEVAIAMMKAIEDFDVHKDIRFSTWVGFKVRAAVSSVYIKASGYPPVVHEVMQVIRRTTRQMTQELGRIPGEKEVFQYLNETGVVERFKKRKQFKKSWFEDRYEAFNLRWLISLELRTSGAQILTSDLESPSSTYSWVETIVSPGESNREKTLELLQEFLETTYFRENKTKNIARLKIGGIFEEVETKGRSIRDEIEPDYKKFKRREDLVHSKLKKFLESKVDIDELLK